MLDRLFAKLNPQENVAQPNSHQLTDLPNEIFLTINQFFPSFKDTVRLSFVNQKLHGLFQPQVVMRAKVGAECAINPTPENLEKLKVLLIECPTLLLYAVIVKNRHGMTIKGTIYQVTLHEGDNDLIDDVLTPTFKKLHNGLEEKEAQRKAWLPEGWMEAEEKMCEIACNAIDDVFTAFKKASNPNDVTQLREEAPYQITINNQEVNQALAAARKAIDDLYLPTNKMIESGRDPIIRLIQRVIYKHTEKFESLGGSGNPRNNAIIRFVFGYCQRHGPNNFMQAFAMGGYYLVVKEHKKKLIRSFAYGNWSGHFILPLDSCADFKLGYDYIAGIAGTLGTGWTGLREDELILKFLSIKQQLYRPNQVRLRQENEIREPVRQVSPSKTCTLI